MRFPWSKPEPAPEPEESEKHREAQREYDAQLASLRKANERVKTKSTGELRKRLSSVSDMLADIAQPTTGKS